VDARPSDAARWVAQAPDAAKAHEVVGVVLSHWQRVRADAIRLLRDTVTAKPKAERRETPCRSGQRL